MIQSNRNSRWNGLVVAIFAAAAFIGQLGTSTQAQNQGNRNGLPEAKYTAEGTERCTKCHAGEAMLLMADTAHGNLDDPHTPYAQKGCESCHGPGSLHVSRARGGIGFPAMILFDERDSIDRQTGACLNCHGDGIGGLEGMEWQDSVHGISELTCIDCHVMHVVGNPLAEPEAQNETCAACHKKQIANHKRFEDKGIVFDKLTCYDCHDVHQLLDTP